MIGEKMNDGRAIQFPEIVTLYSDHNQFIQTVISIIIHFANHRFPFGKLEKTMPASRQ